MPISEINTNEGEDMQSNAVELPTDYQSFIHVSRYARWIEKENRRETTKKSERIENKEERINKK